MIYLAVDKDGTEKASNKPLIRRKGIGYILFGLIPVKGYTKNQRKKWANAWSTEDDNNLPFYGVELPKGTIKKLIGYELSWKDEPVEFK